MQNRLNARQEAASYLVYFLKKDGTQYADPTSYETTPEAAEAKRLYLEKINPNKKVIVIARVPLNGEESK